MTREDQLRAAGEAVREMIDARQAGIDPGIFATVMISEAVLLHVSHHGLDSALFLLKAIANQIADNAAAPAGTVH